MYLSLYKKRQSALEVFWMHDALHTYPKQVDKKSIKLKYHSYS